MKTGSNSKSSLSKLCTRVTALVIARFRSGDVRRELDRLETLPKQRAIAEVSGVIAGLFVLALLAASFGVWGLLAYFAVVVFLFR